MTTTPQRLETVRRLQLAMASAYSALGAWYAYRFSLPFFHPSPPRAKGHPPSELSITNYQTLARCLLHPSSVITLGFTPPYAAMCNWTTSLMMRCFGAQAMTCGLLLGTSTMTASSFRAFGLAMIPFLFYNFWFSGVGPAPGVLTSLLALEVLGNLFFCLGSLYCARLLREVELERKVGKGKSS